MAHRRRPPPRQGPSPHSPSRPRAGGPSTHSSTCHQPRSHMARGGRWPAPPPRPKGNLRTATRVALPAGGRLSEDSPGARARARAAILTPGGRRGRHLGVGRPASALWPALSVVRCRSLSFRRSLGAKRQTFQVNSNFSDTPPPYFGQGFFTCEWGPGW